MGAVRWGWLASIGLHGGLILFVLLGLRILRLEGQLAPAGLVDTRIGEERDYGEVELRLDVAPAVREVAPAAPAATLAPAPEVPVASLEPPAPVPSALQASSPLPAPDAVAPSLPGPTEGSGGGATIPSAVSSLIPNRGKGSPLHGGVNAGKSVVYVLDCSASMGRGERFREACAALLASLEQLDERVRFQVVLYQSYAERLMIDGSADLAAATAENRRRVRQALAKIRPEGTSKHVEGLKTALLLKPSAIFLLTDADDLADDHLATVTRFNGGGAVIYPVVFGGDARLTRTPLLDKLAQANRGRVITRAE